MSRGINKVILIGYIGQDPESRALPNGVMVTNISVATSESWKEKQSGQKQERTEWHKVVMFDNLAEIAAKYLKKGSRIYIEGSLRTRKYQDKTSGQDRYSTEIIAKEMQFLDSKADSQEAPQSAAQGFDRSPPQPAPQQFKADDDFDDQQIPF